MTDNWTNEVDYTGPIYNPTLRYTGSGTAVANGRMRSVRGKGDDQVAVFFSVEAWDDTAEVFDKIQAKDVVRVKGSLRPIKGYTKKDGEVVPDSLGVIADSVEVVDANDRTNVAEDSVPF